MPVTAQHHEAAKVLFNKGLSSEAVRHTLINEEGLTKSQANSCTRTARKQLNIFKPGKKSANKPRAKVEEETPKPKKTKKSK